MPKWNRNCQAAGSAVGRAVARSVIIAIFAFGPSSQTRARNYSYALHAASSVGFADDGTATVLGCQVKTWEKAKV